MATVDDSAKAPRTKNMPLAPEIRDVVTKFVNETRAAGERERKTKEEAGLRGLRAEYAELAATATATAKPCEAWKANLTRCRVADVPCWDDTRVALGTGPEAMSGGGQGSDFIHASCLKLKNVTRPYIVTQVSPCPFLGTLAGAAAHDDGGLLAARLRAAALVHRRLLQLRRQRRLLAEDEGRLPESRQNVHQQQKGVLREREEGRGRLIWTRRRV